MSVELIIGGFVIFMVVSLFAIMIGMMMSVEKASKGLPSRKGVDSVRTAVMINTLI